MLIICLEDDSHEISSLLFQKKIYIRILIATMLNSMFRAKRTNNNYMQIGKMYSPAVCILVQVLEVPLRNHDFSHHDWFELIKK